ncbi:hypothetical protein ILUMI_19209 [Ignelater luminosus]|uniref:Uncharacterized protein n=1 Tax=Ignelater luminosus TaxID=2038154 RepID=A0A8K0G5T5_IGNLU|nr:hypothetical protein ILUMI_19209 [Ignelater luminosus]
MRDLRKTAYETAVKNNLQMSDAWVSKEIAGKEWAFGFMNRHPRLSLRNPEACSLSKATAFNKHNVNTFFDTLNAAMMRNPSFRDGSRVFNLDETGLTTVQSPKRIIAQKGCKQANSVTSAERGQLVTTCNIICARGHALPLAMVFPRVHFKKHML